MAISEINSWLCYCLASCDKYWYIRYTYGQVVRCKHLTNVWEGVSLDSVSLASNVSSHPQESEAFLVLIFTVRNEENMGFRF